MSNLLHLTLVLNPVAGNGRALKTYSQLQRLLRKRKIHFATLVSRKPGQIVSLTHNYAEKVDMQKKENDFLIIIGGDGSLNEAVNGVKKSAHPNLPLAYLPAGSGNDFARAAHLTADPACLLTRLQKKPVAKKVDLGSYIDCCQPEEINYFVNNLGIGFDAFVVHRSNQQQLKQRLNKINNGHLVYAFNILSALWHQDTFAVKVKGAHKTWRFGDAYLSTTTNHPYFGGGIAILPQANLQSHVLDTVIVEKPNLPRFVLLFVKLLVNGSHVGDPHFHYLEAKEIELQIYKPELGQLDGENLPQKAYHLKFKIDHFNLIK